MTLTSQVGGLMARCDVPGVAMGLINDRAEEVLTAGIANIETGQPLDAETIVQCGSVTKAITATLAMHLADARTLDLDAPIRAYLPDFRLADADVAARVTLRHLLTHTGGWRGDNLTDTGRGDDALAAYVADCARLPQIAPLGEVWAYNNAGFCIAGRVVEAVTG
ncbi:MAG: serine hydrolase domain-containing protein, partial [Dehalococcoidia bacterium]